MIIFLNPVSQGEVVAAPGVVGLAVVRISTLPSLGEAAAKPADVFAFLQSLRENGYYLIEPGPNHLAHWSRLCTDMALQGNDANDAFLAALARLPWSVLTRASGVLRA
ncbi:hypothetical protein GN073_08330 [Helicobacter pylori]|nr:hypothetical protein [Helicobacter pylori]